MIEPCEFCDVDASGQHAARCPVHLEAEVARLAGENAEYKKHYVSWERVNRTDNELVEVKAKFAASERARDDAFERAGRRMQERDSFAAESERMREELNSLQAKLNLLYAEIDGASQCDIQRLADEIGMLAGRMNPILYKPGKSSAWLAKRIAEAKRADAKFVEGFATGHSPSEIARGLYEQADAAERGGRT